MHVLHSVLGILVAMVLIGWFAASVVHQVQPQFWRRWAARDRLGLLPRWSFFAPNPGRHDIHVVFRDGTGATWGRWVEIGATPAPRWWRAAWNPYRYARKAVLDLVNGLRTIRADETGSHLLSGYYVAMLDWVMHQPSTHDNEPPASHRQFAVLGRHDHARRVLDVLFVSASHRLEPTGQRTDASPERRAAGPWSPSATGTAATGVPGRQRSGEPWREPPQSTDQSRAGA
jgi:hypothetical protein